MENLSHEEIRDAPEVRDAGLVIVRDHPGIGRSEHGGTTPRLTRTPTRLGRPAPVLGGDNEAILSDVGYTQSEIDALSQSGVIGKPDSLLTNH